MHRTARTCLIVLTALLLAFGICMLYSTSYAAFGERLLRRQLTWITAGCICGGVLWRLDYRQLGRYAWIPLGLVGIALGYLALIAVLHGAGALDEDMLGRLPLVRGPTKGSFRWLQVGFVSVQPSEFAKPAVILFLADYFGRRARHVAEFRRGFLRPMLAAGSILGLIFLGKDLSVTVITGTVVFVLAFVAGVRLRYLTLLAAAGLILVLLALQSSPERMRRLTVYRAPEEAQHREGYQLWNSQLALGSGGWTGLGFTRSRMKQFYLPEAHTDFIVAIVGEELGYLAVASLILTYCLLLATTVWIAVLAADRQGLLLASGVGLSIAVHAFVNISVVSGFGPTTGVTAPFLSYGGSSMIASLLGIGLVLSVSRIGELEAVRQALQGGAEF